MSTLIYDPFSAELRSDPYPTYARLRETSPVHHSPLGFWVLSRYADVEAAQTDRRLGLAGPAALDGVRLAARPGSAAAMAGRAWLLLADPEQHRRFRTSVSTLFAARQVESLRSLITRHARSMTMRLAGEGQADLIAQFAVPLTLNVLCEWLGLPADDWAQCREWSAGLNRVLQPSLEPRAYIQVFATFRDCCRYFRRQADLRRRQPSGDLLSALAGRCADGDVPVVACILLGAAFETTTNLIGNGLLALLRNPDQLAAFRACSEMADQAVTELLRYDSPVQLHGRTALTDMELGGTLIPASSKIILLVGSANHDPAAHRSPDKLCLWRAGPREVSFGGGFHHCLGARFATLSAAIAITALLEELDVSLPVPDRAWWRTDQVAIRGLTCLPVRVRRRRASAAPACQ